ncbi:MAG: family 78 glycoside hydrolase catalytic domain, partial [Treponema sp.]|nr:family 78 glycoside hydrolase catalytic domain [Treponema sp.]
MNWQAQWINPEVSPDTEKRRRASYLRRSFTVEKTQNAKLYITAHGIYNARLNGEEVPGFVLAPGTAQYNKRLPFQEYDVSGHLKPGKNEIVVSIGDGWYRGSMGNDMTINNFGTDAALLCQLEIDGAVVLASDADWQASQNGALGLNDMMKGEEYDARNEVITDWHSVRLEDFGFDNLVEQSSPPITAHEKFSAKIFTAPNGDTVLDFGQNFAGFVEFELNARAGQTITLQHGETLDAEGNFTIANFQNSRNPHCCQKVIYTCKDGLNRYRPSKCYFGFRYVKVESDIAINGTEFTGLAVYSDIPQTGFFSCGNETVNRLVHNTLWSMKSNFVDVPTDCPTREKSGFSGDCQVFTDTAMYLMDCYPVYRKWLLEQQATQYEDGCVKQIAPDGRTERHFCDGAAGWCDSIEIVPYKLWRRYNDDTAVRENYDCLKKWLNFCLERNKTTRDEYQWLPEDLQPFFADQGMHWGEWLEPGADVVAYMTNIGQHGEPEVATAYLSYGCALAAEMAAHLDNTEDAAYFSRAAEKAKQAYRLAFVKDGIIDSPRQCRYVRPIALNLLTEDEKRNNARILAQKIAENGGKLNTGFLTTSELCRVLTDYGQTETAYRLLLQTESPGWLYPVEQGATTILEQWDGIKEDGGVAGSFNHYSYGSIAGWLFDRVCGIRLEWGDITIRPYPHKALGHAEAVYHS